MKRFIQTFLSLLFYCTLNAYSQNTDIYNDILQKLTPQSPQASMMQRFGNYPVDYSTGVPNISVPLYTIKIGDFELPISIDYHASGIRVQDVATPVGLGWALNAGGCITKQVRGNEDRGELDVRNHDEIMHKVATNFVGESYWSCLATGESGDTQTDRYSYNFCGHSGIFRKNANTYTYLTLPYSNMIIDETESKTVKSKYGGFVITNGYKLTDDSGIEYYFDYIEFSRGDYTYSAPYIPTAYYLTKIILANKCDSIVFKYQEGCRYSIQNRPCIVDFGDVAEYYYEENHGWDARDGLNVTRNFLNDKSSVHTIEISTTLLKAIEWNGNKVEFNYIADRQESMPHTNKKLDRLVSVSVTNNNAKVLKHITLDNNRYMRNGNSPYTNRMLLKSINIRGCDINENGEDYVFAYNDVSLPSYCVHKGEGGDIYCYEDYWGYYNGKKSFGNIPKDFIPKNLYSKSSEDADRTPDERYMKAGILETIIFPTGGKTVFNFESNRLDDGTVWGGLRVKSKTDYDRNGKIVSEKTYKYERAVPSVSPRDFKDLFCYTRIYVHYAVSQLHWISYSHRSMHTINTGEPCVPLSADYGSSIYYYKVTETEENLKRKNVTEYKYDDARTGDMGLFGYEDMDYFAWMQVQDYSQYGNFDFGNLSVVPTKITKYDSNGNSVYTQINEYEDVLMDTVLMGVKLVKSYTFQNVQTGDTYPSKSELGKDPDWAKEHTQYINNNYYMPEVWGIPSYKRLSKRTESKDGITKTTSYAYDEQKRTLKPISEQINENQILTKYTFPYESNDAVSKGMQECNMIVPVKTNVYINGTLSRTDSVAYAQWYNGAYLPTDYYYSLGSGKLEKRCSCTYDKLNRLFSITKDNTASTMFVWLKKYDFPVAKIEGLTPEILKQKINIHLYDVFLSENIGNIDDIVRSNVDSNIYPVTTYKQEPLVGITRIISPTKASTTFKYDSMWRLNSIFDDKNFKISQYEYNYAK